MTGFNRKAFESLLPSFAEAYEQSRINPDVERKRAVGGGRKATLRTPCEKLFYILLYCKCYPTFELLGILFDFDRSCAWDWVHGLLPVLEQVSGYKQALPEGKLRSLEEFLERFPDEVAIEADLGFQGLQNEFDNVHLPHKKPKGKELNEQQKQENREFSR